VTSHFNTTRYTVFDTPVIKTLLRGVSLLVLWVQGWHREGQTPDNVPKYVVVGAPHTSWYDAVFALAIAFVYRIKIFWLAKASAFRWPFRSLLLWLGGIPVDRAGGQDMVSQAIHQFQVNDRLIIVLTPEGTRKRVDAWKSGFYHIAMGANVPILLAFNDYLSRKIGFGPLITLTGDQDADMKKIAEFYADKKGRHPERIGPVRLRSQMAPPSQPPGGPHGPAEHP
jgi:1-acyl-sn-glycerol-3-phosphate acyltransferase